MKEQAFVEHLKEMEIDTSNYDLKSKFNRLEFDSLVLCVSYQNIHSMKYYTISLVDLDSLDLKLTSSFEEMLKIIENKLYLPF